MIYTRWGSKIVFTRHITTTDEVEQVENRKSDSHDVERLEVDAYMAGRLFEIDEKERLFDLSLVRADGGWQEVRAAIEAVSTKGGNR